jgi:hypothetical protein
MKRFVPTILSIALALGGAGVTAPAAAASPRAAQVGTAAVKFVPRQIRQANRRLRYTVKAKYPQALGAARDPRLARLNQELRRLTVREVGQFTKDFAAPEERMGAVGSYFESQYTTSSASGSASAPTTRARPTRTTTVWSSTTT